MELAVSAANSRGSEVTDPSGQLRRRLVELHIDGSGPQGNPRYGGQADVVRAAQPEWEIVASRLLGRPGIRRW